MAAATVLQPLISLDRFELDCQGASNYIAGDGPIRDPIPTQFALTLFTLSGRPVAR